MYLVAILLYICYAKAKNGLPGSQSSAGGLNQKKRYYYETEKNRLRFNIPAPCHRGCPMELQYFRLLSGRSNPAYTEPACLVQ